MNVVLLGATKGMGRALARVMAARGDRLFLLGRDEEDLERSARDLDARSEREPAATPRAGAAFAYCDLERPETFDPALEAAKAELGVVDAVVVTAGLFASQDELESDPELCRRLLVVDFAHTVLFCERARRVLLAEGGTLCVFSSVAGDRGRRPVVLYGAAKAGLTRYLEGLDHRYRRSGLKVVCVKPGFVRTGMTEGLPAPPFAGEPDGVARTVLRAIDRGKPVVYAPSMWALIMLVVRNLPRVVMRRVGF
jgi:NAD(P)-dependent dehydrogenase (short-subunit alcohol dehydrogenase family)